MKKIIKNNNKIAIILLAIILIVFSFFAIKTIFPALRKQVVLVIPEDSSVNDISQLLKEKEVIANPWVFKFFVFVSQNTEKLKPGRYVFKKNSSYRETIKTLVGGPKKVFYDLTIPEGFTLNQVGKRLSKLSGRNLDEFNVLVNDPKLFSYDFLKNKNISNLEGYLFPETYRLYAETQVTDAVNMMLNQFKKEYESIKRKKVPLKLNTHQIVTIASLIEREAKIKEEQPIIAGVIYNRLKKGMKLEIDATIQYALKKRKKKLKLKDLEINSPYNTYKNKGLPPSPIGNPGKEALKAALMPAKVKYLYYVLIDEKSGKHFFTDSYKEFLRVKQKNK